MEEQDQINRPFFSGPFIQIVSRYKTHLSIIGIVAIILSIIFSSPYFITPLFKSEVILYPTASKSISKALLSETFGSTKDILEFGEEEQTEQMLQVLNSNKIRDRVVKKYHLLDHYDIPADSKYKMTRLYQTYESNFRFRRTEYMAVQITVYDKDPQLAADIANDIAELVDSTINRMQKEVAVKAFEIVEEEYLKLRAEIQKKEDSLTTLRELGVHDYESQSEMFNRQLAIEMAKGNTSGVKRLEERLEVLAKYGGPYVSIRDALEHDKKQLSEIKAKYDEAKVDATESLPHKFIVSNAYKAERKSYPIRWLIVVGSLFSALFLAVLVFGAMEVLSGRVKLDLKKKSLKTIRNAKISVADNLKIKNPVEQKKSEKSIAPIDDIIDKEQDAGPEKKVPVENNPDQQTDEIIKEVKKNERQPKVADRDNNTNDMDNFFNSSNLMKLIDKWKYHLLGIAIIAVILSAIFSGPAFITPMYKSYAVVYPANVEPYSEESETEQMLQIMNSQDIIDSVIEKFDLPKHYEIDPDYKYFKTTMLYEYSQNVHISKTAYESVLIEVFDKDPDTAKQMVDAIIKFYDNKVSRLHKSKYSEVVNMYGSQLAFKRNTLDSLKQIMFRLGTEYGIFEYEYQSQEIMRGYLKTLMGSGADRVNSKEVKRLLTSMEQKGGQLIEVVQMIQDEARSYVEVKLDYEMALRFLKADMTFSNIVTYPFIADKKSYPIRWLVVVVVTLAVLVFSTVVIMIVEKRKS